MTPPTVGERLANIVRYVSGPRIMIADAGEDMGRGIAIVKLALLLKSQPGVLFQSIMEEWDHQRIVRELY